MKSNIHLVAAALQPNILVTIGHGISCFLFL